MQVLVGLGSNIRPQANVREALGRLALAGPVVAVSRVWRTPPVGVRGGEFLNAAAIVEANGLGELRRRLRAIERALGRPAAHDPRDARTIDLDVLAVRASGGDGGWTVLEPKLGEQTFQLLPALDLVPDLVLPDGQRADAVAAEHPLRSASATGKMIFQSAEPLSPRRP